MKKIIMFDTSYGSQNMGDYIINKSINKELDFLLKDNFVVRYSTHTPIQKFFQNFHKNNISRACQSANYKFLCGTNIFKYDLIHLAPDFNINIFDINNYRDSVSVGCGITPNKKRINTYTKFIYKNILSKNFIHSTRDEKTKEFLESLGFKAINTGCPTLWNLTENFCKTINTKKSNKVVFTLTDYKKSEVDDQKLIDLLNKYYDEIFFWIQGFNDFEYFKSLKNIEKIKIVSPNIEAYDQLLSKGNIDYIGTRLHAGIFAMQHRVRSVILIVDNRTRDMNEKYNLNAVERNDIERLENMINSDIITNVRIDEDKINEWKKQFLKGE